MILILVQDPKGEWFALSKNDIALIRLDKMT